MNRPLKKSSSVFTKEEIYFITKNLLNGKKVEEVRRAFRKQFFPNSPRKVPKVQRFHDVRKRLIHYGSAHPQSRNPKTTTAETKIENVKQYFIANKDKSIRDASAELNLSFGSVRDILRNKLRWKFYRPRKVQVLSEENKQSRLSACNFWLTFPEEWFDKIIWTDEKWFLLEQAPHSKNDGYWAPSNQNEIVPCKKAHGAKVMAWVGIIDGRVLPIVWFEGSVNSDVYLDLVLKKTVWASVKNIATRRQYWFQQDGASCHVTAPCLQFLAEKFGQRIISRNTENHWPPYSPDLSPLDFSFWNEVNMKLRKKKLQTIAALKRNVEEIAAQMSEDQVRSMARNTRKRATLCARELGGHFEHLM